MNDKCYYCGESSTSIEHVPPKCFFPKEDRSSYKIDLITVPSCDKHNLEKSKDDEFLRSICGSELSANIKAIQYEKIFRSLIRRDASLLKATMKNIRPVSIGINQTCVFNYNKERFNQCIVNIAKGLYFNEYKKQCNYNWQIVNIKEIFTISSTESRNNAIGYFDCLTQFLNKNRFDVIQTSAPSVFQYSRANVEKYSSYCIYKLRFYEGIEILAAPHLKTLKNISKG